MKDKNNLIEKISHLTEQEQEKISQAIDAVRQPRSFASLAFIEQLLRLTYLGSVPAERLYRYEMRVTELLYNRYGMLHGGVMATFIDTGMGAAAQRHKETEDDFVTIDLHIRYLVPVFLATLVLEIHILKEGRSTLLMEAKVLDPAHDVVAVASATFFRQK